MSGLIYRLKVIYYFLIKNIAFYPVLISAFFIAAAFLILNYEEEQFSKYLHDYVMLFTTTNAETARTILSTIISGILSLTVFSFTLVMLVLNQAASNSSPRLIPGLISTRSHQQILGFYIGTIIYTLIILVNVKPKANFVPALAILISIGLTIISIGLFVYFIHSISNSIQIGNLAESLYTQTLRQIDEKLKFQKKQKPENFEFTEAKILNSKKSGFLQSIDKDDLVEIALKNDIVIEVLVPPGMYVVNDTPLLKINKEIKDENEIFDEVLGKVIFNEKEIVALNFIFGFKHLSEVAVKALSPGINDPATAIRVMNYMQELFSKIIFLAGKEYYRDEKGKLRVIQNQINLRELLFNYFDPLRNYGKKDVQIMLKQIEVIKHLLKQCENDDVKKYELNEYLDSLIEDSDIEIKNSLHRKKINESLTEIENITGQKVNLLLNKTG